MRESNSGVSHKKMSSTTPRALVLKEVPHQTGRTGDGHTRRLGNSGSSIMSQASRVARRLQSTKPSWRSSVSRGSSFRYGGRDPALSEKGGARGRQRDHPVLPPSDRGGGAGPPGTQKNFTVLCAREDEHFGVCFVRIFKKCQKCQKRDLWACFKVKKFPAASRWTQTRAHTKKKLKNYLAIFFHTIKAVNQPTLKDTANQLIF